MSTPEEKNRLKEFQILSRLCAVMFEKHKVSYGIDHIGDGVIYTSSRRQFLAECTKHNEITVQELEYLTARWRNILDVDILG